jgi:hypothetical protein
MSWIQKLQYNPLPVLENAPNAAIRYFLEKDVLDTRPQKNLWNAPEVTRLMHTQQANGACVYAGGNERIREKTHYNQLETYRNVGILVEKYDLNRTHPGIAKAAEFLFSCQTQEGDFRGIY